MKAALVDFLLQAHQIPNLIRIILFGSLIEGDVNKKSDIDLLLIFESDQNPEIGIELKTATKIGLDILTNYKIENNFSFVAVNTKTPSKTDRDFLIETASNGIVVWERGGFDFLAKHTESKPQIIFDYSTRNLSSANKRKLFREIAEIAKTYGKKLGKGVIMVEKKHANRMENVLKECKAVYKKQEIFS